MERMETGVLERTDVSEILGRLVAVQDQEEMAGLRASENVSVDDGYVRMLPYLFEWIGGYDVTVAGEGSMHRLRSADAYYDFRRFLERKGVDCTGRSLYAAKFLKEMGLPYVRDGRGTGCTFLVRLAERR